MKSISRVISGQVVGELRALKKHHKWKNQFDLCPRHDSICDVKSWPRVKTEEACYARLTHF
jgi:hypothetical protein